MSARRVAGRVARGVASALYTTVRAGGDAPARARALQRGTTEVCAIHDLAIAVHGKPPGGPCVVVANHVSYLDALVLTSLFPCAPIAKSEVAHWPLIGAAARRLGVTFVNRTSPLSGARALRRAQAALEAGVSVLNFPEGTTSDGSTVLPFRRGIFGLARIVGVPVVPVALRYASPDLAWFGGATFLPHYLRMAARRAPAVHVDIGTPIAIDWRPADDLARLARLRITRMLHVEDPDGSIVRLRVPASRPDPVLPAPRRRAVALG